jgi:hypothetical protein
MNNFKEKDRVFHIHYGWGNIVIVHNENSVEVEFDNSFGLCLIDCNLLSFTEYTLNGFTQERPFEPVVGQMYYFWDDRFIKNKTVVYSSYRGIGINKNHPYLSQTGGAFQHISETNPLL